MIKLFHVFIFTILGIHFSIDAWAVLDCKTKQQLDARARTCEDNPIYADAGVECLNKLQKLVKDKAVITADQMAASNKKNVGERTNQQKNTYNGASDNFKISQQTIDQLLADANSVADQIVKYQDDMFVPDDIGVLDKTGLDVNSFLDGEPCFKDTEEVLDNVLEDAEDIINDLEATKASLAGLEKASDANKSLVDTTSLTGAGTVSTDPKKSDESAAKMKPKGSSVSGTVESKKSKKVQEQIQNSVK